MSVDVPRFVASRGIEGKVIRPNTMVSCNPVCNPLETMGDKFIMMAVFNSETSSYDMVYWPADFSSTTEPVRVERVASQPVILSFVQTGLEVVTSPPPDPDMTTTSEPTTPDKPVTAETSTTNNGGEPITRKPISATLKLSLTIVIPVGTAVVVSGAVMFIIIICLTKKKKASSLETPLQETSQTHPIYATVSNTPAETVMPSFQALYPALGTPVQETRNLLQTPSEADTNSTTASLRSSCASTPTPPTPDPSPRNTNNTTSIKNTVV